MTQWFILLIDQWSLLATRPYQGRVPSKLAASGPRLPELAKPLAHGSCRHQLPSVPGVPPRG